MNRSVPGATHERHNIESLPLLGRTWYRRGPAYWLRRAVVSFMCVVVLALFTLMTGGLVDGIATADIPLWPRVIILAVIAAAIVHSMVKAWTAFDTVNRARKRGVGMSMAQATGDARNYRQRRRSAIAGGGGLGALALTGSVVGGGLLAISVVFNFGWGIVLLLVSFQKYVTPDEFAAWQTIKRQQQTR